MQHWLEVEIAQWVNTEESFWWPIAKWVRKEMFYLMTHSTHFIYGYMASDIWLRTILIVRKEIRCHHIGYSFRLAARFLLYAPSHRQDSTYHSLCYTGHGALAGTRNQNEWTLHHGATSCSDSCVGRSVMEDSISFPVNCYLIKKKVVIKVQSSDVLEVRWVGRLISIEKHVEILK